MEVMFINCCWIRIVGTGDGEGVIGTLDDPVSSYYFPYNQPVSINVLNDKCMRPALGSGESDRTNTMYDVLYHMIVD